MLQLAARTNTNREISEKFVLLTQQQKSTNAKTEKEWILHGRETLTYLKAKTEKEIVTECCGTKQLRKF